MSSPPFCRVVKRLAQGHTSGPCRSCNQSGFEEILQVLTDSSSVCGRKPLQCPTRWPPGSGEDTSTAGTSVTCRCLPGSPGSSCGPGREPSFQALLPPSPSSPPTRPRYLQELGADFELGPGHPLLLCPPLALSDAPEEVRDGPRDDALLLLRHRHVETGAHSVRLPGPRLRGQRWKEGGTQHPGGASEPRTPAASPSFTSQPGSLPGLVPKPQPATQQHARTTKPQLHLSCSERGSVSHQTGSPRQQWLWVGRGSLPARRPAPWHCSPRSSPPRACSRR